jgi:hypothetical protein
MGLQKQVIDDEPVIDYTAAMYKLFRQSRASAEET